MTTAIFLVLFMALLVGALNWLPIATPTDSLLLSGWTYLIGNMKAWNWLLPITEVFYAVGIVIAYEILVWSWFHVIVPVVRTIRGGTN